MNSGNAGPALSPIPWAWSSELNVNPHLLNTPGGSVPVDCPDSSVLAKLLAGQGHVLAPTSPGLLSSRLRPGPPR